MRKDPALRRRRGPPFPPAHRHEELRHHRRSPAECPERANRLRHLRGGDILALPTEGVADPVDEIVKALFVFAHQVAGAKPCVTRRENVVNDPLLGIACVKVTLEPIADVACTAHIGTNRLARFVRKAADAETALIANQRIRLEFHQNRRCAMRQKRRNTPNRAGFAFNVEQRDGALRCGVKLKDLRYLKTILKGPPDIGPQAIATSILIRCAVSFAEGSLCSRYRQSSPIYWNSVQSQRSMSAQN